MITDENLRQALKEWSKRFDTLLKRFRDMYEQLEPVARKSKEDVGSIQSDLASILKGAEKAKKKIDQILKQTPQRLRRPTK